MKKVLHVSCGGLGRGGVSTVIFSIVNGLKSMFDFEFVVFKKRCEREELFASIGSLHRINAYNDDGKRHLAELILRPFILYFGIYKLCKKNNYDVIHCHNLNDEGICLLAAKNAGTAVRIAHSHNTASPKKRSRIYVYQEKINRYLIKHSATKCVSCSKAAGEAYFGNDSFQVIYNSVDLDMFKPALKENNSDPVFIHVGRYTYQKNQEFVIRIFECLHEKFKKSRLLLVGYGEDDNKLRNLARQLNLTLDIDFIPGNTTDVPKLYDQADYLIFPSIYEGFGIVLIEAQAKNIPCFVSEEIQKEADAGLLTFISLEKTPQEWADIIYQYIDKTKAVDYDQISENLRKYSIQSVNDCYMKLYKG